ncbi:MAG: hypothetical protein QM811_09385 [Pirellulales bacterium]
MSFVTALRVLMKRSWQRKGDFAFGLCHAIVLPVLPQLAHFDVVA